MPIKWIPKKAPDTVHRIFSTIPVGTVFSGRFRNINGHWIKPTPATPTPDILILCGISNLILYKECGLNEAVYDYVEEDIYISLEPPEC